MPIYMLYPGIKGTAKGKHTGWIELDSAQIGVRRSGGGVGGDGSGSSSSVSEIVVTKQQDASSSALFTESLNGSAKTVTLEFVDDSGVVYLTLKLENTLISSYSFSGRGAGSNTGVELLTLNFTKINYAKVAAVDMGADGPMWQMAS